VLPKGSARREDRAHGQLAFLPIGAAQPLVPPDGSPSEQRANRRLEIRLID
jgi:hypothetical protein